MKKTLILYCLIYLTACSVSLRDQKKAETQVSPDPQVQQENNLDKNLKTEICKYLCSLSWSFLEVEPGTYNLKLQWKNLDQSEGKIRFYLDSKLISSEDVKKEEFIISQIGSNEEQKIQLEWISQKDGLIDVREQNIKGPLELVIKDSLYLQNDLVFNGERVYFYKNSKLITNGFNVKIQTQKLQVDQAEILTFEDGSKANLNQIGKSGGEISIEANETQGSLQVNMRGQHGGDGINGEPWSYSAPNGQTGDAGQSEYDSCVRPVVSNTNSDTSICRSRYYCSRESVGSAPGANGQPGRSGSNGLSGGDSGIFELKILTTNNLDVKVNTQVGFGGLGGLGSPGQMGGLGGPEIRGVANCRKHAAAPNGQQGPAGQNGQTGASGNKQSACISYDNSRFCY